MDREYTIPIKFGPNGCQAMVGDKQCQETESLEIIKKFNRIYQSKLQEIGNIGGGDNLQLKVNLQQNWIRDLTEQNEMLVKIVEELEKEAVDKVLLLQKKLETSSISSEKAHKDVTKLDYKVKDLERRLSESPTEGDLDTLNYKLRPKEEEVNSIKRPKTLEKSTPVVVEMLEGTSKIDELSQLRDEVATYVKKCDNLVNKSKAKDEIIRNLRKDLNNLEKRYDKATNEVECKDNVINKLRNRIQRMEKTVTDLEKVKISGKQSGNAVRENTPHPSSIAKLSLKVPSRSRVTRKIKTPGAQTASTRICKIPIPKQSVKMTSTGESKIVQTKHHPSRSVYIDTKSLTTTKSKRGSSRSASMSPKQSGVSRKSRVGTQARCKCGSSSKSDTLECLSQSVGTQAEVVRKSAHTTTRKQRKPLIASSPRPRSPTYSTIYDIPLTPRDPPPPPPKHFEHEVCSPKPCTYLYENQNCQNNRPCTPRWHMVIPNQPCPIATSPRNCFCNDRAPTLSCKNVLHEHYRISNTNGQRGFIKNFVAITDRLPIQSYINNFEMKIKRQNEERKGFD